MAEARFSQDELLCTVCLDLLKDPVTIQCGHSYCKSCIKNCWDQKRVYSCPQCRQTFSPRPALGKNTILAELVEKLTTITLSADCYAGAGDVQCDVCTGRKYKATKSCLMCLNSYCQTHFDVMKYLPVVFCDIHYHLFVLQKQLKETQKTFEQRIQQREKDLQQLRETVESHKVSLEKKRSLSQSQFRLTEAESLCVLTALLNNRLRLSENNRVITDTNTVQPYPDHPDRFDYYLQVLCRESVCGCCYWELEWSGCVRISVSYKSISRKGRGYECVFGRNDQSWGLDCSPSSFTFSHNNKWTDLPVKSISSRIGVFVDHSAGTLSFYSDTMSLIHTVQTTFTQPLYPGFWVSGSSTGNWEELDPN
uniref:Uncharacterized protein n=1 Tax=Cyprinus carpio TaxID=7962 RepID=A0A8C1RN09_CYPCA